MAIRLMSKIVKNGKLIVAGILMVIVLFTIVGCQSSEKTLTPPSNASCSYNCSVSQGLNFQKDQQDLLGHIEYLKIGSATGSSDFTVIDPMDPSNSVKVTGIISSMYWGGGYADPLQISCQVSTSNKNTIATLTDKDLSNTEVELAFSVYDYDYGANTYYKCFHTNSVKLKGLVATSGDEMQIAIDVDQSMEVKSPKNYTFTLGVMPQGIRQSLLMALSATDGFEKQWGIEVD